jgi:CspA family cold shock protein
MPTGTVKFFNEEKGFGFIKPDDGSKDLFVHKTNISSAYIRDGDAVTYEVGDSPKGPCAVEVAKQD